LDPEPGEIYVFGNPLVYRFTNRTQALPVHGWAWEFFIDEQWDALPDQLEKHKPPYIFCTSGYLSLIGKKSFTTQTILKTDYVEAAQTSTGNWYARHDIEERDR